MTLRMQKAVLSVPDRSIAKVPPKVADPFYHSTDWKVLRQAVFHRDGPMCATEGCTRRAVVVDHILSRRNGGKDELSNLRGLCRTFDNGSKEDAVGVRRGKR